MCYSMNKNILLQEKNELQHELVTPFVHKVILIYLYSRTIFSNLKNKVKDTKNTQ